MIYKKCQRCEVKLKRTQMVKRSVLYFGGRIKVKTWFCKNELKDKIYFESSWREPISEIIFNNFSMLGKK